MEEADAEMQEGRGTAGTEAATAVAIADEEADGQHKEVQHQHHQLQEEKGCKLDNEADSCGSSDDFSDCCEDEEESTKEATEKAAATEEEEVKEHESIHEKFCGIQKRWIGKLNL